MNKPLARLSIYFNVHLVSDSTGETLNAIQRAACAQFKNVQPLEHNYYLVRSERQRERVMREIEAAPGVVWYTISDETLRSKLEAFCREKGVSIGVRNSGSYCSCALCAACLPADLALPA